MTGLSRTKLAQHLFDFDKTGFHGQSKEKIGVLTANKGFVKGSVPIQQIPSENRIAGEDGRTANQE